MKTPILNIAVIGAGAAGLTSVQQSLARGYNVTVFEQENELGGIWRSTAGAGKNEFENDIHTTCYKNLITNGPHQLMEYSYFHYSNDIVNRKTSYLSQSDVLKYLRSFADRFDLNKHIKFNHLVVRVLPIENDRWEITIKDLPNGKYIIDIFDAVFVCNGHFCAPNIPQIEGANEFKGKRIHSYHYRSTDPFHGDDVLVIGGGSSGSDLSRKLMNVANSVTISRNIIPNDCHKKRINLENSLPSKIGLKDNVKRFTIDGAEFIDGTTQTFTSVIYATGYKYSFPFLSVDSGIHVDNKYVEPLYKFIINIEHPSMAIIGLLNGEANFRIFELQTQFMMKFLSKEKQLPSESEMIKDLRIQTQKIWKDRDPKRKTLRMLDADRDYVNQLATVGDIESIPEVLQALSEDALIETLQNPTKFRNLKYHIIDSRTFTKEYFDN